MSDVETERGHKDNWPRQCARSSVKLSEALAAFIPRMDETNMDFALPEFIDERVRMAVYSLNRDLP